MTPNPATAEEFPDADVLYLTQHGARQRPGLPPKDRQLLLCACVTSLRQLTPAQPLPLAFQQHLLDIALEYEGKYHALLAQDERRRSKAREASQQWLLKHGNQPRKPRLT